VFLKFNLYIECWWTNFKHHYCVTNTYFLTGHQGDPWLVIVLFYTFLLHRWLSTVDCYKVEFINHYVIIFYQGLLFFILTSWFTGELTLKMTKRGHKLRLQVSFTGTYFALPSTSKLRLMLYQRVYPTCIYPMTWQNIAVWPGILSILSITFHVIFDPNYFCNFFYSCLLTCLTLVWDAKMHAMKKMLRSFIPWHVVQIIPVIQLINNKRSNVHFMSFIDLCGFFLLWAFPLALSMKMDGEV
jgi:hypothetical protein